MSAVEVINDSGPVAVNLDQPAAPGYVATSITSQACVAAGPVSLTTQDGLAYSAGARVRATSAATGEWIEGVVSSYLNSVLTFTADLCSGAGTHADWHINVAGERGAAGAPGILSAIASQVEAAAGSDNTKGMTPLRTAQAIAAFSIFTKAFVSGQQTMSLGGLLTIAHGFGVVPTLIQAHYECLVAEGGYAVGDKIIANNAQSDTAGGGAGHQIIIDATNIAVRFSSNAVGEAFNKTTGAIFALTAANWALVIRAFA